MRCTLLVILGCASLLLAAGGCGSKTETTAEEDPVYRVGLVFDVGGRGDKSFNDSAFAGLDRAKRELGISFEYIEPGEGADRESALRMMAARGIELVFGVGFLFTDDITRVARDFPKTTFACIDYAVRPGEEIPLNLVAIKFKEEEGSFLVGALAGLVTKTDVVGFLGGMDSPLIKKFEKGFLAGVAHVNPDCRVLVSYAGVTGEAFKDPLKGKELSIAMYESQADIIYHASGTTGLGLFEAARQTGKLAIGVDSDQWDEAPGHVLTSMMKRVDESVYRTIKAGVEGTLQGGLQVLGLEEGGVGYVYDERNMTLVGEETHQTLQEISQLLTTGEIDPLAEPVGGDAG
jgi:basic membrane protein A